MSKVKRLNFTVSKFESVVPYASEHGQYVRYADYAKLEAEAQALREEVAALRMARDDFKLERDLARQNFCDEQAANYQLQAHLKSCIGELAELRARVVVPDGFALVPIEPNDEMLSAGCVADNAMHSNLSNRDNKHRCYQSMLNAAPRLNGKAVSEGLLRRLARPAHRYDEVFTVDRHEAAEELRALLGEEKEHE
ncbi:TPA: hypothetical protein RQ692_004059 [Pseudomonas aeruginosa]|nr:hypothetical protein [Pseudomonas aeruginosa]